MFVLWQCVDFEISDQSPDDGACGCARASLVEDAEPGLGSWNVSQLRELLRDVARAGRVIEDLEISTDVPGLGQRTIVLNAQPLARTEGRRARVLLAIEDVTDRRLAEEALRTSESRYRRLFEEADRRRTRLLATLAHELRNPLAPIVAGLHVLQSETDTAKKAWALGVMDRQVRHLVRVIENLIDGFGG